MKTLRNALIVALVCSFSLAVQAQEKFQIVPQAGLLTITGTSNTSDWKLTSHELTGDAQLMVNNGEVQNIARVIIDIDGKSIQNIMNKRMTKKAQKALMVSDYPEITFFAYGFASTPDGKKKIKGTISMAGSTSDILFDFTTRTQDDIVWIVAQADSKFTDFGIDPPTDFGGAVTCKDEIKIEVQLPFELPSSSGQ